MTHWQRRVLFGWVAPAVLVAAVMGCSAPEKRQETAEEAPALLRLAQTAYPVFKDDADYDGLDHGIAKSLSYLGKVPVSRTFTFADDTYTAAHMIRSLEVFRRAIRSAPSADDLNRLIRSSYRVYRSTGDTDGGGVLFTGYYEPVLRGSPNRKGEYRFPLYARPDDHVTVDLSLFSDQFKNASIVGRMDGGRFVPYHDRKAIENGAALEGKARALAWLSDPVDVFFLHIQGSGKILLDTGQVLNVHYHTTNGRPYRSIGKYLIEQGAIPKKDMSMQAIRSYLRAHPETVDTVLNTNPSYVFFKLEPDGPIGNLGVKLTPGRSIATDHRIFPASALTFIQTQQPLIDADGRIRTWTALNRFTLNQDTGGAIRGPGRADLYWGSGPYAELAAGHMQHTGTLYFLVLKPDAGSTKTTAALSVRGLVLDTPGENR